MKLSEVLEIPEFNKMKVISGEEGLHHQITTVSMMDAPDIENFLSENEFLVTTAFHFKDSPELIVNLIQKMHDKGCSGLGIKTKRFIHEIPYEAIQLSNALHFPLIELPLDLSLNEVVTYLLQKMLNKRENDLSLALETHETFTKLLMKGKSIEQLIQQLSQMIHTPIQLVDQYLNPIAQSHANVTFDKIDENFFTFSKDHLKFFNLSFLTTKNTYTFIPVYITAKKCGYLLMPGDIPHTNSVAMVVAEQAVNVLSFALMKEYALKQQQQNTKNIFMKRFLDGYFTTEKEISSRLHEFSISSKKPYIFVVGKLDEMDTLASYNKSEQLEEIFEFIESENAKFEIPIHFFTKEGTCLLLLEANDVTISSSEYSKPLLESLQNRIENRFDQTISFGVSNVHQTFFNCRGGYKEAIEALSKGELAKKKNYIQIYDVRDIVELLRFIPYDNLRAYYENVLRKFQLKNDEEREMLLETVSVYLETHCQIGETAKRLFIHRNTVVYRLEKCEEILGESLKNPNFTIQLRIAFRIKQLLDL